MPRRIPSKNLTTRISSPSRQSQAQTWPMGQSRARVQWFPAGQRLISLVRSSQGNYVLPPAVVRKASWRD